MECWTGEGNLVPGQLKDMHRTLTSEISLRRQAIQRGRDHRRNPGQFVSWISHKLSSLWGDVLQRDAFYDPTCFLTHRVLRYFLTGLDCPLVGFDLLVG